MIKFFRKIRKKLLSENKFRKYLTYAIGEIILVVIGILIALQVNNWNERNILNQKATIFLKNIKSDLENDYKQLSRVIHIQKNRFIFIDSILSNPKHTTQQSKIITGRNETFFPLVGTYKSSTQDGLINNISNEQLRFAIINLYEHHYTRLQYNGEINDQRHEDIEWHSRNYINHNERGFNFTANALENKDFLNQLTYLNKFTKIYTDRANLTKNILDNILKMIDDELK